MAGLSTFCKEHNIPAENVEYRYCRVVAFGPIINNINADPQLFPSKTKLTIGHIIQEVYAVRDELLKITEPAFKKIVLQRSQEILAFITTHKLEAESNKSVAEYVAHNTSVNNRFEIVKQLLTFDGIFLGLKLTASVMNAHTKERVIAFAGGTHIEEAYELLQHVAGYEPITQSDKNNAGKPFGLIQSVNANIPLSKIGPKPEPISIRTARALS